MKVLQNNYFKIYNIKKMSKTIFIVTKETYCDGDSDFEIGNAYITEDAAIKDMNDWADAIMEDGNEFGPNDYERYDEGERVIITSNSASLEICISIQETTLNEY